jgi:hypothetical protein
MLTKVLRGKPYTTGSDMLFSFATHVKSPLPEWLRRLAPRLLPRDAYVLEQAIIYLLHQFAEGSAFTAARAPDAHRIHPPGRRA